MRGANDRPSEGGPDAMGVETEATRSSLLQWYDRQARDLPWRRCEDPYGVWISEIMLQQTRVETVIDHYLRWMSRFPTITTLARATEDDVLRQWAGMGYYARARNLHRTAQAVVNDHGGRLPTHSSLLRTLPGIGEYTAGAIASIVHGERVPAVDGNVLRVLARWAADDGDITTTATRRRLTRLAAHLVDPERPGDWNQALMELGATVCTPRTPHCRACPIATGCAAFAQGRVADLPVRARRAPPREERVRLAFVESNGRVLLTRAPDGMLGGLWGLPGGPEEDLAPLVAEQTGIECALADRVGQAQHRFTHRLWHMEVYRARPLKAEDPGPDAKWVPVHALREQAISVAHRKAVAVALADHTLDTG